LLLLVLSYFGYYSFFLRDDFSFYLKELPSITQRVNNRKISLEINIYDYKKEDCEISYCLLNSCNSKITLPCDKLIKNTFQSEGNYTLELNFERYFLFPLPKTYLSNWEIVRNDDAKEDLSKKNYLNGVMEVLGNYSIREGHSCLVSKESDRVEEWMCNNRNFFSNDYLKSIYLTYELGTKLKNESLLLSVNEEIEYLNKNKEEILLKSETFPPDAYILKLTELGLDKEYLKIIDEFIIPSTQKGVIEDHDFMPLLSINSEIYSKQYAEIVRYGGYYKIYKEYDKEDLSNYYLNELIRKYNISEYVLYGLCTVGYSTLDANTFEYIKDKLEESIHNAEEVLILNTVPELLVCDKYADLMNSEIEGIDNAIQNAVKTSTWKIDEKAFIIAATRTCDGNSEICNNIFFNYRLVDNLMYLLYE